MCIRHIYPSLLPRSPSRTLYPDREPRTPCKLTLYAYFASLGTWQQPQPALLNSNPVHAAVFCKVLFKNFFPSLALSPTPLTDAVLCVGLIGLWCSLALIPFLTLLNFTGTMP